MFKLLHGKLFSGRNSSPVHLKCSLALMLQRCYWDQGTLCTCPLSNPLTHNIVPDGGQIGFIKVTVQFERCFRFMEHISVIS